MEYFAGFLDFVNQIFTGTDNFVLGSVRKLDLKKLHLYHLLLFRLS